MGVVRVLDHNMVARSSSTPCARATTRAISPRRVRRRRPLSACDIALELAIPRVVVPRHPGIASALGLLATDLKVEVARTVMVEAGGVDPAFLNDVYEELEAEGRARLRADGVPEGGRVLERWADCRYTGQAYELLIRGACRQSRRLALRALADAFHERHEREYFWRFTDKPVQLVHLRVYAIGVMPALAAEEIEAGAREPPAGALRSRRCLSPSRWTARSSASTRRSGTPVRSGPGTSSPARPSSSTRIRRPSSARASWPKSIATGAC